MFGEVRLRKDGLNNVAWVFFTTNRLSKGRYHGLSFTASRSELMELEERCMESLLFNFLAHEPWEEIVSAWTSVAGSKITNGITNATIDSHRDEIEATAEKAKEYLDKYPDAQFFKFS